MSNGSNGSRTVVSSDKHHNGSSSIAVTAGNNDITLPCSLASLVRRTWRLVMNGIHITAE